MTARSAEEAREEVRNASDIVQIVGERVRLRRMGRAWKGLCPFHVEKTPSFTVNSERQMWHCFGCNKGGDVFAFIMEMDKLTFPEALAALAERAGVELPQGGKGPGNAKRDRLYQANALANDFFKASMRSPAGAKARAYMTGRGFDDALLDRFQVGWAPEGWDGLVLALGKLMPGDVLEEAGLTLRRGDGTHYDRFRNRVTFPIEASAGKVVGFGARSIVAEEMPKYINSPETPIYRKGGVLFGLPSARAGIREGKRVLVVEGYLDVMRLRSAGYPNAVSTSGTALTSEQARSLARLEAEVLLVYDGDDAGVRAADRALEPLLQAGLSVRVLILPDGEDPDSFIAKRGAAAFEALLKSAADIAAFLAGAALGAGTANPSAEARVKRYVELLGKVDDPIRRRMMVRRGSAVFGIEEEVILEALSKRRVRGQLPDRSPKGGATYASAPGSRASERGVAPDGTPSLEAGRPGESPAPATAIPELFDPVEKELAARCLTEEGAIAEVVANGGDRCFRSNTLRALLRSWLQMARAPLPDELRALTDLEPAARALLADHAVEEGRTDELSRRGARELLQRLEERRLRASIQVLDQAIRQAERDQDPSSLDQLVAERRDLASKLHGKSHAAFS